MSIASYGVWVVTRERRGETKGVLPRAARHNFFSRRAKIRQKIPRKMRQNPHLPPIRVLKFVYRPGVPRPASGGAGKKKRKPPRVQLYTPGRQKFMQKIFLILIKNPGHRRAFSRQAPQGTHFIFYASAPHATFLFLRRGSSLPSP